MVPIDNQTSHLTIIGIDCAAQPKDVGIAIGACGQDGPRVESVLSARSMVWDQIVEYVSTLIDGANPILVALDAPLGWPQALGRALHAHIAGGALTGLGADQMFHRLTDDVIRKQVGKKPLEVGADRIARTAHRALWFLDRLREATGLGVPLAWTPGPVTGVKVIEVYPAATLAGRGLPTTGYKTGATAPENRRDLVRKLTSIVDLGPHEEELGKDDDLLDAALCVVAGADFVSGDVLSPSNEELEQARREGWIWVRLQRPDPDLNHVLR